MSEPYNGLPGRETILGTRSVTGASNTTPIEITTSAAHGLVDGEYVQITGVKGNWTANGRFYVLISATNKFKLYSSFTGGAPSGPVAGAGAYTSGGSIRPLTWANAVAIPSDDDDVTAIVVNVPFEGNFDREAWLLRACGKSRIVGQYLVSKDTVTAPNDNYYTSGSISPASWESTGLEVTNTYGDRPDVGPSDGVLVTLTTGILTPAVNWALGLSLDLCDYDGGNVVNSFVSSLVPLSSSTNVTIHAAISNAASYGKQLRAYIKGYNFSSTTSYTYQLIGCLRMSTMVLAGNY